MQISSGRSKKRFAKAIEVKGHRSDGTSLPEGTFTDNVSKRGVRLVIEARLEPGETIEIRSPEEGGFELRGRVVYCERLLDGKFAVGIEVQTEESSETGKTASRNPFF